MPTQSQGCTKKWSIIYPILHKRASIGSKVGFIWNRFRQDGNSSWQTDGI